jgi:hypothetical protein
MNRYTFSPQEEAEFDMVMAQAREDAWTFGISQRFEAYLEQFAPEERMQRVLAMCTQQTLLGDRAIFFLQSDPEAERSVINDQLGPRRLSCPSSSRQDWQYAILAFSESSDYVSDVQTPKCRPVQRERIVLNLDRCRKFVELLERRVDNKADPLHFRRS